MSLKDYDFSLRSSQVALGFLLAIAFSILMSIYLTLDHFHLIPHKKYIQKYCYFVTNKGQVIKGIAADDKSKIKFVKGIFDSDNNDESRSYTMDDITELQPCQKVDIVKYIGPDSLIVKIRFKVRYGQRGGGTVYENETGYVPKFLLHDTTCKICGKDSISYQ